MTRANAHHHARLPPNGEYRAGGRVHTPGRVGPPVGRLQLNTAMQSHYSLTQEGLSAPSRRLTVRLPWPPGA